MSDPRDTPPGLDRIIAAHGPLTKPVFPAWMIKMQATLVQLALSKEARDLRQARLTEMSGLPAKGAFDAWSSRPVADYRQAERA